MLYLRNLWMEKKKIKTKKSNYLKDYLCHLETKHIYFSRKMKHVFFLFSAFGGEKDTRNK